MGPFIRGNAAEGKPALSLVGSPLIKGKCSAAITPKPGLPAVPSGRYVGDAIGMKPRCSPLRLLLDRWRVLGLAWVLTLRLPGGEATPGSVGSRRTTAIRACP